MLTVQMKEANENQHLLEDIEIPVQRIDQGYTIGRTIANGAGLLACGVIAALFRDLNTLKIVGPLGGLCLLNMLGDGSEAWRKRVRKIPTNQLQGAVGAVGVKQCLALMGKENQDPAKLKATLRNLTAAVQESVKKFHGIDINDIFVNDPIHIDEGIECEEEWKGLNSALKSLFIRIIGAERALEQLREQVKAKEDEVEKLKNAPVLGNPKELQEAQSDLKASRSLVDTMKWQLTVLQETQKSSEAENQKLAKEREELRSAHEKALKASQVELNSLKGQLAALQETQKTSTTENQKLSGERDELRSTHEKALKASQVELNSLKGQLAALQETQKTSTTENQKLAKERDELRSAHENALKASQTELNNLKTQLAVLQETQKTSNTENQKLSGERDELRSAHEKALKASQTELNNLKTQLAVLQETQKTSTTENQKLSGERDELRSAHEKASKASQAELNNLKTQLAVLQEAQKNSNTENQKLSGERDKLEKASKASQAELNNLKTQLADLQKTQKNSETENQKLSRKQNELQSAHENASKAYQTQLEKLQLDLQNAKKELDAKQQYITEVAESLSQKSVELIQLQKSLKDKEAAPPLKKVIESLDEADARLVELNKEQEELAATLKKEEAALGEEIIKLQRNQEKIKKKDWDLKDDKDDLPLKKYRVQECEANLAIMRAKIAIAQAQTKEAIVQSNRIKQHNNLKSGGLNSSVKSAQSTGTKEKK